MPDLQSEREHLAEADRHITDGRRLLARVEASVAYATEHGLDTEQGLRSLEAMKEVMVTFEAHRANIVRTIADLEAGRL